MHADDLVAALERAGVPRDRIACALRERPDVRDVLAGFEDLEDEVRKSVAAIRSHPLMPADVAVAGFTIDIDTGELSPVSPDAAREHGGPY